MSSTPQERARRLYKAPGFRRAYVEGARARIAGRARTDCPYDTYGWALVFRRAWEHGYDSITPEEDE